MMNTTIRENPTMLGFDAFATLAQNQFVPLRVQTDEPARFSGLMQGERAGEIDAVDIRATSHVVERTPELIAKGGADRYKLTLQLAGTGLLIQDNREALLHPGDIAIYDTARPYTLAFEQECHILVFMFPKRLMDLPVDSVGELTAVRFPGDTGIGQIVSPLLARTGTLGGSLARPTATRLTYGALDLVTTMIGEALDQRVGGLDPHAQLVRRITGYIDEHIADADLAPAQIAAAHYISTRHLHALFSAQGTTVSSWIRERRFERCRRDLADPLQADRTVGQIAARWGLHDAAHFSRVFKSMFGVSPSEHRRATAAAA